MKSILLLILFHLTLPLFCQQAIVGPWTMECGASSDNGFKKYSSLNLRYISPRFKLSDEDWSEEEEEHPEKSKRGRLMLELMYTPPFEVLSTGFNMQYRFLKFKKLSFEIYGGVKFFFATGSDFVIKPQYVKVLNRGVWFMNAGLILQLDLGLIGPFVDVGGDGIITIGTEIDFPSIGKKIRNRYKPPYLRT